MGDMGRLAESVVPKNQSKDFKILFSSFQNRNSLFGKINKVRFFSIVKQAQTTLPKSFFLSPRK